jgi:hypothetical protein
MFVTIPIRATTLTPFNYGHLAVQGGVATIPEVIPDRAICFALCAALGLMSRRSVLPTKDYLRDLRAMPWRAAMFTTCTPRLLPPLARRSDLGVEGGYPDKVRRAAASGNFKEFFSIQEVPPQQVFQGAIFGADPFVVAGRRVAALVVRIGSNRAGMVELRRDDSITHVRLNAATAALFGRTLRAERYLLDEMQMTAALPLPAAAEEVAAWT